MKNKISFTQTASEGSGMKSAAESEISKKICLFVELDDMKGNQIGEVTLESIKVDEDTTEWQGAFWAVVRMANYANNIPSIVRGNEAKFEDMTRAAAASYADLNVFYTHYQQMVDELVLSSKFIEDCNAMNLDLQAVAQHLVFEGELMYSVVKEFGPRCFYRTMIEKFNDPIYTLE
jgi:hypothetical protein